MRQQYPEVTPVTELDRKLRAKIPGDDTGIRIKRTLCDICAPGSHCGVDAYVRDGRIIKVEGTRQHPVNKGVLCTRGACSREYVYSSDRIHTPLRRIGPRGAGE